MNAESPANIQSPCEALFFAALRLPDQRTRSAMLDDHCPDARLRREVERLLEAHGRLGGFLETGPLQSLPLETVIQALTLELGELNEGRSQAELPPDFLQPTSYPGALGRVGKYEILGTIGAGAFGVVLQGFDVRLERPVAIKVLDRQVATRATARRRFLREARAAAAVRDPRVVQIHDVVEEPWPYLVMEFVPGVTLQEELETRGSFEIAEVLRIGREIARGLAAAHALGIIHRDVKPSNILVERGPSLDIKLTDFGLACAAEDASRTLSLHNQIADTQVVATQAVDTQDGLIAGTPLFMSPEQVTAAVLDHRVDLFSLGCVLYCLASGRPPFEADTSIAVMRQVAEVSPRPLSAIRPEVPAELSAYIERLLSKTPTDRPATAAEVAQQFDQLLDHWIARQDSKAAVLPHASRRVSLSTGMATACVLLVVGLGLAETYGVTDWMKALLSYVTPHATSPDRVNVAGINDPDINGPSDGAASPAADSISAPNASAAARPALPAIKPADDWVSLLEILDVKADHIGGVGEWTRVGDEVEAFSANYLDNAVRLRLPVDIQSGDYELEVHFTRLQGDHCLCVDVPVRDRGFSYLPWWRGESGLMFIDDRPIGAGNPTTKPATVDSHRRYRVLIQIRTEADNAHVLATVNDEQQVNWQGPIQSLTCVSGVFANGRIDLASDPGNRNRFHAVRLRLHSGQALLLRPRESATAPQSPRQDQSNDLPH